MPLPTLAMQVTPTGVSAPSYAEILQSLKESFWGIYGSDAYLEPDSQDGQWLAILAQSINDTNQMGMAVYLAFSPTYAQGAGLSSVVKINGIRRQASSFSTAVGDVVGNAGTTIINGVVADEDGNKWDLPVSVTIPIGGSVAVTVTAQEAGAISAPTGTINVIETPTRGWQTFTSTSDATAGAPVETDATLRRRQAVSVALAAVTPVGSLLAAIANLPGVTRSQVYENFTGSVDANGLPPHSISAVVEGGDVQDIINAIGLKKTPGTNTYGTTSGSYEDPLTGITYTFDFFILATSAIEVEITGTALSGYSSASEDNIKAAVAAYINALGIGQTLQYLRMFGPAYLNATREGLTYEITALTINITGDPPGTIDIPIDFNKAASCDEADITVTIT